MSIDWGSELDRVEKATKPITEGVHSFRIVEAKPATASTGNKMIKLTCKVEGGPDDGKVSYTNIVFTFDNPRAMKMTLRRLASLGINPDTLKAENPSIEQIAGKLMGRKADGTVSHRMWNGEVQDDINFGVGSSSPGVAAPPTIDGPGVPSIPTPSVPDVAPAPAPAASEEAPPAPVIPSEGEPEKPKAF